MSVSYHRSHTGSCKLQTFNLDTTNFGLGMSFSKANEVPRIICNPQRWDHGSKPWDWLIEHGLTSALTQYRLYGRRFLQTYRHRGSKAVATKTEGNIEATKYILEQ